MSHTPGNESHTSSPQGGNGGTPDSSSHAQAGQYSQGQESRPREALGQSAHSGSYGQGHSPYGSMTPAGQSAPSSQYGHPTQHAAAPAYSQNHQYGTSPSSYPAATGYSQPYGSAGYPGQPPAPQSSGEPAFFQALFDMDFKHFITVKFSKVLYILGIVAIGLSWLFMVIAGFASDSLLGFLTLFLGAGMAFLYVVFFRMTLEMFVALIRTAQNSTLIADRLTEK